MTSMLTLSNDVSAQVAATNDATEVTPQILVVHFWHRGRKVTSLSWQRVVEDLTTEMPVLAAEEWLELTAYDRYLIDAAGWDLLMAHGILPTQWRQ